MAPAPRRGRLDVLAQHVMARACGDGFDAVKLYDEITVAAPYADLTWEMWERVIDLVATGGHALRTYDRFRRIVKFPDGVWRARNDDVRRQHRMNVGTIIEEPMISVRQVSFVKGTAAGQEGKRLMRAGRKLGEMEEYFFEMLTPGDTFLFAGEVLRFEGISDTDALVTKTFDPDPQIPSYTGGKFPLTTFLADRVRTMLHDGGVAACEYSRMIFTVTDWIEKAQIQEALLRYCERDTLAMVELRRELKRRAD